MNKQFSCHCFFGTSHWVESFSCWCAVEYHQSENGFSIFTSVGGSVNLHFSMHFSTALYSVSITLLTPSTIHSIQFFPSWIIKELFPFISKKAFFDVIDDDSHRASICRRRLMGFLGFHTDEESGFMAFIFDISFANKTASQGQTINKSHFFDLSFRPFLRSDHSRYYGISSSWVDWTSMIYMILYIPLVFPGSWLLDKLVSNGLFMCGSLVPIVRTDERVCRAKLKCH